LEKQCSDLQSSLATTMADREKANGDAARANKLAADRETEINRVTHSPVSEANHKPNLHVE
jgi:hypothetical protein